MKFSSFSLTSFLLVASQVLVEAETSKKNLSTLRGRGHVGRILKGGGGGGRPASTDAGPEYGQCMQDYFQYYNAPHTQSLQCTAKEVYLIEESIAADVDQNTCTKGSTIKINGITSNINFNAARYDPGWYIATDGGDALSGECAIQPLMSDGSFTILEGTAEISWDDDHKGGKDKCGDITGGAVLGAVELLKDTEVVCDTTRDDNKLEFTICFSWRTAGRDDMCDPDALYPGTVAKCFCDTYPLQEVEVVPDSTPQPTPAPTAAPTAEPTAAPTAEPTPPPTSEPITFTSRSGQKLCLDDAAGVVDETCVDGNMEIESINTVSSGSCVIGETVTVSVQANIRVQSNDATVFDPAYYIGTDGGDAQTGTCHSTAFTSDNSYTLSDGATVSYDSDACGDIELSSGSTLLTNVNLLVDQEIVCTDHSENGVLDIPVCLAWKTDSSSTCDPTDPVTSAVQCNCQRYDLPNMSIHTDDPAVPRC